MDKRLAGGRVVALTAIPAAGIYGTDKFPAKGGSAARWRSSIHGKFLMLRFARLKGNWARVLGGFRIKKNQNKP